MTRCMAAAKFPVVRCGRLTKSGTACRTAVQRFEFGCKLHVSEEEKELSLALMRAFVEGRREGYAMGAADVQRRVDVLERQVRVLRGG